MAINLSWNTEQVVASGTAYSYSYPSSNAYTFRIYAKATLSGQTATITFRYTIQSNGTYYQQYSGPYWTFYINGTSKGSAHKEGMASAYVEEQLCSYSISLTASGGSFATTSAKGVWTRDGTSGYAPKDCTIEATGITLPSIGTPVEYYYYNGSTWVQITSSTKIYGYTSSGWRRINI